MKHVLKASRLPATVLIVANLAVLGCFVPPASADAPAEKLIDAPCGVRVSVKMIGPVAQITDLQVICVLKHDRAGDKYIEAMKDLNDKLGGLLSSLRDRGDFVGELGETFLFTPPANSIAPTRVLLIGVGEESALTIDVLRLAGRIALREAARLNVARVSFAPTLRDQGSTRISVDEGDAAVVEQFLLACDTQKRLEAESLTPGNKVTELTIEAGPKYFEGVVEKVAAAVASANREIKRRSGAPYHVAGKRSLN